MVACVGDCNGDGVVTVDELITEVNIALEIIPVTKCRAGDRNMDNQITIDEILAGVGNALDNCSVGPPPTPTGSPSGTPTATPPPTDTPTARTPPPDTATSTPNAPICGNERIEGAEACDDGNTNAGDGCDATCQVEPGYTCSGTPSICQHQVTGEDAIGAASRLATNTIGAIQIIDFGPVGSPRVQAAQARRRWRSARMPGGWTAARAAAATAVLEDCKDGGTKQTSCQLNNQVSELTEVFSNCRQTDANMTIALNGTRQRVVADPTFCSSGTMTDTVADTLRLTNFTADFTCNQNCPDGLHAGALSAHNLELARQPVGDPPRLETMIQAGSLEVTNTVTGEQFAQIFGGDPLHLTETANADGSDGFTITGSVKVGCLGDVRFDTTKEIQFTTDAKCARRGAFEVTLPVMQEGAARAVSVAAVSSVGKTEALATAGGSGVDDGSGFRQRLYRAANGQVYQLLQNIDADVQNGADGVQVTAVVGSEDVVAACSSSASTTLHSPARAILVAPGGQAFPPEAVFKSPLVSSAAPAIFNPNGNSGNGILCVGSDCSADCTGPASPTCTAFTITGGTPITTATDDVPAASLVDVGDTCSAFPSQATYRFGSTGPTTEAAACAASPADGFRLPSGTSVIFAYDAPLTTHFEAGVARFAVAGSESDQCTTGQLLGIASASVADRVPAPRVEYNGDGGVQFDFNSDDTVDKTVGSCEDVSLRSCAPVSLATPTPNPVCEGEQLDSAPSVVFVGSTAGAQNRSSGGTCGGGVSAAPDATFFYDAPLSGFYTVDTLGSDFDTLLVVRSTTCAGAERACNDDSVGLQSAVGLTLAAGERIAITVDGFANQSGAFRLHVKFVSDTAPTATPTPMGSPLLPDLTVVEVTAPLAGAPGGSITVSATVENHGLVAARVFQVQFLFSLDPTISGNDISTEFGCIFAGLSAGEAAVCTGSVNIPASLPRGTYYVGAIADPLNQVAETSEANNARAADSPIVVGSALFSGNDVFAGGIAEALAVAEQNQHGHPAVVVGSIAVFDLDGDGIADRVAVAGDSVLVSLGTTPGSFGTAQAFSVGSRPRSVAVADLDGDGVLDLVTANSGSDDVSVLFGQGGGSFAAARSFSVGSGPRSVAIADLNGDGQLDIATANSFSNDVSVLLGTGGGTFSDQSRFPVGGTPRSVAVGDLNVDGVLDLVTANANSDDVSILLGTGGGLFATERRLAAGDTPSAVAVADLNRDALPDLLTANTDSGDLSVLVGVGGGLFAAQQRFPVGIGQPGSLALADLNNDTALDVVITSPTDDRFFVFFGAGGTPVRLSSTPAGLTNSLLTAR